MTRLLLVDDHALFRESLARLLASETGLVVHAQCSTVEEALAWIERGQIDLVLLDYELGDRRGNEVVLAAERLNFAGKILVVTVGLTMPEARHIINHGVAGIFLKNDPPETLFEAIQAVVAGHNWIDPKFRLAGTSAPGGDRLTRTRFTDRDRQVLRGVFEGHANKEIAEGLGVSESAIKASLQQLFAKTGVRTRGQLVRVALEHYRRELL
jgi:DNA-binding NarL/FixJ family response regulator